MNSDKPEQSNNDISVGKAALIAGIGLIIMVIIAPVANFLILQGIIIPDDAAKTVANIQNFETLFRIGIILFLIVAILDLIVAWALYIFLKPVNKNLSLLTAWFRIVYATILAVIIIFLVNVLQLINGADYLASVSNDQTNAMIMISLKNFYRGWELGLILFGIHLLLLGYLFIKAGYMKKILGYLIILAALGYMIDGSGKILIPGYNLNIAMFTFLGEILLLFWLLIKGRKIGISN